MKQLQKFLLTGLLMLLSPVSMALETVSLQFEWLYQFEYSGFIAAKEKGFYEEAGLNVEFREYKPGENNIQKVLDGEINYGIHNSSLIIENQKLVNNVLLATYLQKSPLVFVTDKSIKRPYDLAGKKIMGTSEEFKFSSLALLLNHFQVNASNTTFKEHSFEIEDFISGKVDAMSAFRTNQFYMLDKLGIEYNVIDPADYGYSTGAVNLYASYNEVEKNPQRTQRFVEASNKGWKYALEHKEEIIQIIFDKYSQKKSLEALRYEADKTQAIMLLDLFPIGFISQELSKRTFSHLKLAGMIAPDTKYHFTTLGDILHHKASIHEFTEQQESYLNNKKQLNLCIDPQWMP